MDANQKLIEICAVLQTHSVQYLLIGGTAVGFHGYYRMSSQMDGTISEKQDFDFWYNPTYTNYFNLLFALKELGNDVDEFIKEQTPNPRKSFFKFAFNNFTIDFLPVVDGLSSFSLSHKKRKLSIIENIEISIISKDDLLISKSQTARKKDFDDIEKLRSIDTED